MTALEEYGRHRDRLHPHPAEPSLLVSMQGTRMDIIPAERVFARLTRAAGIAPLSDRTRPTMKNLRHTFAVSMLMQLVPVRRRRRGPAAGPVHVARSRRPPGYVLVFANQPGTPRPRRPESRRIPR